MLVLALCLGALPAATVMANDPMLPQSAAITKILRTAIGLDVDTIPELVFTFEFTEVGIDGDETADAKSNMPAISDVTITFATDMMTLASPLTNPYNASGMTHYVMEKEFIDAATFTHAWSNAGVYEYLITEKTTFVADPPLEQTKSTGGYDETVVLSEASYTFFLFVEEHPDTGELFLAGFGAYRETADDGSISVGKADPTPGGNQDTYFWSQVIFNNNFLRDYDDDDDPPPTPDPDYAALIVSKDLDGKGLVDADSETKYTFSITLIESELYASFYPDDMPSEHYAYVWDIAAGAVVADLSGRDDASSIDSTSYDYDVYVFPMGGTTTFELYPGEQLCFVSLPDGTGYEITENATPFFQPTYSIITAGADVNSFSGSTGYAFSFQETEYVGHTNQTNENLKNEAAWVNICNFNPTTGLSLNDLSFIGLIVLAVGGLILFVVVKSRRKKNDEEEIVTGEFCPTDARI